jgi:hypothetical protein
VTPIHAKVLAVDSWLLAKLHDLPLERPLTEAERAGFQKLEAQIAAFAVEQKLAALIAPFVGFIPALNQAGYLRPLKTRV